MPQSGPLLLFLDLETTGHDPLAQKDGGLVLWHEIIDFGAVVVDQRDLEEILGTYETKVQPVHPERCLPNLVNHYLERAARGEWANALSLQETIRGFLSFLSKFDQQLVPGGQGFFFDWSFLLPAFVYCGIDEKEWGRFLHYSRFDTRSMAMQALLDPGQIYFPEEFSIRTGRLPEKLGLDPEPEVHTAINGAMKSLEIYRKLRRLETPRPQS